MKLQALVLTEAEDFHNEIQAVIAKTLGMSITSHYWHWQTKSFASHKAFNKFYDEMTDLADTLAEQYMGAGGSFNIELTANMSPFSLEQSVQDLALFKQQVVGLEAKLMREENAQFHGIADTMIEVVKQVDQLQYMLTLK